MPHPDGSPTDDEAGDEQQQAASGATNLPSPVPAWRKVLWVLAVLYALFLIITAML